MPTWLDLLKRFEFPLSKDDPSVVLPKPIWDTLKPHQQIGVRWAVYWNGRYPNGAAPGLGKSFMVLFDCDTSQKIIATLLYFQLLDKSAFPALIIAPEKMLEVFFVSWCDDVIV